MKCWVWQARASIYDMWIRQICFFLASGSGSFNSYAYAYSLSLSVEHKSLKTFFGCA